MHLKCNCIRISALKSALISATKTLQCNHKCNPSATTGALIVHQNTLKVYEEQHVLNTLSYYHTNEKQQPIDTVVCLVIQGRKSLHHLLAYKNTNLQQPIKLPAEVSICQ